ncbi:MAG: hypothetical protein M1818_001381 [Claussenomyces sp. TS43310]|nr:MAG: hypothetical protein M1818_001381 [Claussenomyces sp. TS43310]
MQNPAVRKSKPSRSTRVAQLESKLDNLVSLVQSSQLVSEDEKRDSPASTAASSSTQAPSSASHPSSQTDSGTSISQAGPAHYDLPQRDPDSLLTVFREELADQFPFVIIPPAVTAHDLGQSKPILLKTILMVTSFHDKTSQVAMAHEIMEYYSLHILLKAEKSLELLQSLLVSLACVLIYLTETALFVPLPSRQAILHACLTSTQSFFSLYLSIPLDNYHKITYVSGLQLTYALTVLDKLSHTESDDWDSTHVQGVVNISLVLDGIIARFEAIEGYGRRAPGDTDLLTKFLPMFRYHRQEVERKRAALMTSLTDYAQMEFSPVPHSDIGGMSGVIFSDLDDAFWQEIIVDFPEQGY